MGYIPAARRRHALAVIGRLAAGAWLGLIVAASARADLLISTERGDNVLRYDGTTGAFLGTLVPSGLGGLDRPIGMTIGPDGLLYVAGSYSDNILKYSLSTGEFLGQFIGPGSDGVDYPLAIKFGPDGAFYASDYATNSVRKFDPVTGAFLGTAAAHPTMIDPLDFTFGPNGDLFVCGYASGTLMRFDSSGQHLRTLSYPGSMPWGVEFGPDGYLYVASFAGDVVGKIDALTLDILGYFASGHGLDGAGDIAFGPDGNLYVASWYSASVLRFDGSTGAFLDEFVASRSGGLSGPKAILFTPIPELGSLGLAAVAAVIATLWLRKQSRHISATRSAGNTR